MNRRTKRRTAVGNASGKMRPAAANVAGEVRSAAGDMWRCVSREMGAASASRMSAAGMTTSLIRSRHGTNDHAQGKAYCRCAGCYLGHVGNPFWINRINATYGTLFLFGGNPDAAMQRCHFHTLV
jgi:hypothetical protein